MALFYAILLVHSTWHGDIFHWSLKTVRLVYEVVVSFITLFNNNGWRLSLKMNSPFNINKLRHILMACARNSSVVQIVALFGIKLSSVQLKKIPQVPSKRENWNWHTLISPLYYSTTTYKKIMSWMDELWFSLSIISSKSTSIFRNNGFYYNCYYNQVFFGGTRVQLLHFKWCLNSLYKPEGKILPMNVLCVICMYIIVLGSLFFTTTVQVAFLVKSETHPMFLSLNSANLKRKTQL